MSIPFPWVPTPGIIFPPPPPHPPPPPWSPPPSPTPKSAGGAIAGISIAVGIMLFLVSCICSLTRGQRQSGADAVADAATESAALGSRLRTAAPDQPRGAALPDGEPRRAGPAADLPSFTYNRSVKHNVTGSGDEAATCSVCLAAFRVGETVRLLPVCLHLYHVECIDPWLDAHSSCPICRTGTDLAMDGGLLPPV
nr:NEP1-interacting protein-like 1 [Setaria viridis]